MTEGKYFALSKEANDLLLLFHLQLYHKNIFWHMYTLQKDKDLNLKYQILLLVLKNNCTLFYFHCCHIIILFLHSIMYTRS